MGISEMITGLIGTLLYPMFSIVFLAVDGLQSVFFAFAGIGDISYGNGFSFTPITSGNSGKENDTGIVYYLMNNDLVQNLLTSIMLLALFLIIIFTVMAFIKNAYAAKQKSWKEIIGNSIKGLANFIFLPICCFLGVWLGNILLQAINGATSTGGATLMSRKLFMAAAYNANHYRNGTKDDAGHLRNAYNLAFYNKDQLPFKESDIKDGLSQEEYAEMVDQLFASPCISIYDQASVGCGYSLFQINYLVIIVGGIFMLYVLGSLTFAMVRRLFYLLTLFVISPGICAMYPLDEGKAVGSWAGEVKKLVLSAYGAVAGMNIFFSLLPLVNNIHLGTGFIAAASSLVLDDLIQLFVMVSGLLVVKELIGTISNLVGGEDAYSKGSSLMKSTAGAVKKHGGGAIKTATKFAGQVKGAKAAGKTGASAFFGTAAKSMGLGALKGVTAGAIDPKDIKKTYNEARKDAKEHAWDGYDSRTNASKHRDDALFESMFTKVVIDKNGKRKRIGLDPGEQIDRMDIFNFLNRVSDDSAKKRYEEQLIAHNTRAAMFDTTHDSSGKRKKAATRGGAELIKEGSYIEGAKEFKNHQKAMGEQKEELKVKLSDLSDAQLDVNDAKVDLQSMGLQGATPEEMKTAFKKAIAESKFEVKTIEEDEKGNKKEVIHEALQADILQGRLDTRTYFSSEDITKAGTEAGKAMLEFNKHLKSLEDFESKTKAVETANKAVEAASKNLAKTIEDTASKLKIPKPDTSALERTLKDVAKDASKMGDELDKVIEKLKKFKDIK